MPMKKIVLGPEFDEVTRKAFRAAVTNMNGRITNERFGTAGSQDVYEFNVEFGNGIELEAEEETYMGLSVSGDDELVERFFAKFKEVLRN